MTIDVDGLPVVGEGRHGKVYRLDETHCIKVYWQRSYKEKELKVLTVSQHSAFFPSVIESGEDYIIREYFDGPSLNQYLTTNKFTDDLAQQLIEIIDTFAQLNFTRLDCRLAHIIVTEGNRLRIIDPTRNMTKVLAYPKKLLRGLKALGLRDQFLAYVKESDPEKYARWNKR